MNFDGEQAITCTDTVAETNSIINNKHSSKLFEILRKVYGRQKVRRKKDWVHLSVENIYLH